MDYTKSQRYHTQLNTNVLISKWVEMTATVGLAYLTGNYQQQGMDNVSNPILAAYSRAPLLSPYKKDNDGLVIPDFSQAGYGNGIDIPVVSLPERTITISPLEDKEADNTQHIQKAIDEVGKYALDAEGI